MYIFGTLMKTVIHNILSLVMAFVVLISTMSFTLNMHYCGDTLVETTVFKKAKGCGMDMDKPATKGCNITKKNCCDDKQSLIDGPDELQLAVDTLSFEQQLFIATFADTYVHLFEGIDQNVTRYKAYKPPIVIKQLYKIDETYLI